MYNQLTCNEWFAGEIVWFALLPPHLNDTTVLLNRYLRLASCPLTAEKCKTQQENRLKNTKHFINICYLLPCQNVSGVIFYLNELNLKTQFVSFTHKLHCSLEVATSCVLTHTFKFPSLKNEQVAVLDSTRQTVLGDILRYWILFIGRAGVHRIDQPNRHMHYLLQGPTATMWQEHRGSLLIRKESQRDFFF